MQVMGSETIDKAWVGVSLASIIPVFKTNRAWLSTPALTLLNPATVVSWSALLLFGQWCMACTHISPSQPLF